MWFHLSLLPACWCIRTSCKSRSCKKTTYIVGPVLGTSSHYNESPARGVLHQGVAPCDFAAAIEAQDHRYPR